MVSLTHIKDPMTLEREVSDVPWSRGRTVASYLPRYTNDGSLIVEHNGRLLTGLECASRYVEPGDRIILLESAGAQAIGTFIFFAFLSAAVNVTISAITSALARNQPGRTNTDDDESASRAFTGIQNTVGGGIPIPLVYGETRIGGHIIESFTSPPFSLVDSTDPDVTVVGGSFKDEERFAQTLNTRRVLCHGPIESISSHEIDSNPVENIRGVMIEELLGTRDQRHMKGFEFSRNEQLVQQVVSFSGGPITDTTDQPVIGVEVELLWQAGLFELETGSGDIITREVEIEFLYKRSTAVTYTSFAKTKFGRSNTGPTRIWVRFPPLDPDIYDIRVERITADNVDPNISDEFRFEKLTGILAEEPQAHPGLAQVGTSQVPQELSAVPQNYTCIVKGFNDIRIYSDPVTFTTGWTDNNAWCCAHFITHALHGLGKFYGWDDIDIPAFIRWAEDNDEFVSNGRGGLEKRAVFNSAIDSPARATEILNLFTEGTRAFLLEKSGKISVALKKPQPPAMVFTEDDYEEGSLVSSWLAKSERANRITAHFRNREIEYERDSIILEDDAAIQAGEHFVDISVNLWGVDRPSQVLRTLARELAQNRNETRTVKFRAGLKALYLDVGQVFSLATRTANIGLANGVLLRVSSDKLFLELDAEVTLDPAKTYEIMVEHQLDGVRSSKLLVNVTADTTNWVEVSNALWARDLQPGDVYALGEAGAVADKGTEEYICVKKRLREDLKTEVEGVLYSEASFDETIPDIDEPASLPSATRLVFNPNKIPLEPEDLFVQARLVGTAPVIDVSWGASLNSAITSYEVSIRKTPPAEDKWRLVANLLRATSFTIKDGLENSTDYMIVVRGLRGRNISLDFVTFTTVTTPA